MRFKPKNENANWLQKSTLKEVNKESILLKKKNKSRNQGRTMSSSYNIIQTNYYVIDLHKLANIWAPLNYWNSSTQLFQNNWQFNQNEEDIIQQK